MLFLEDARSTPIVTLTLYIASADDHDAGPEIPTTIIRRGLFFWSQARRERRERRCRSIPGPYDNWAPFSSF